MDMFTGPEITQLRRSMKLTMAEFAKEVGVTEGAISLWESGQRHPRFQTLILLNELKKRNSPKNGNGKHKK